MTDADDKRFTVSKHKLLTPQVLFDTSKKEMLNPSQGYKKFVGKLKNRYKCEINKSELNLKTLKKANMLLLGGPRLPFTAQELQDIRKYIEDGGRVVITMAEGGENKLNTNVNAMLEQVGISVNSDSVVRKTFHKYLHPKEAFVGNGCLSNELVK